MASSKWYFYPDNAGDDLQILDCVVGASDVQVNPGRDATTTVAGTGKTTTLLHGGRATIRVIIEIGNDLLVARRLRTLESFLKTGLPCGFAFDSDKAYAYVLEDTPPRGTVNLRVGLSVTSAWSGASVSADDTVVLQSPLPSMFTEYNKINTVSGDAVTLVEEIQRTFLDAPVILRNEWFFPALLLAPSEYERPLVTHDHGFAWTFDATFWEDVYTLAQFDHLALGSTTSGSTGDALGSSTATSVDVGFISGVAVGDPIGGVF